MSNPRPIQADSAGTSMSVAAETHVAPPPSSPEVHLTTPSDRRADIDAKQTRLAALLKEAQSDSLLLIDPDNVAWMTSGAAARGILDPNEAPAVYMSGEGRWILSSNVDSQRLFDEELDGLGFQLKEWPWHWGRAQLLADLCEGRHVACDQLLHDCKVVGNQIRHMRRKLTAYEQACHRAVGQILSHALEACCRTLMPGDTEREVAGQLSHRLLHRGAQPLALNVAAESRLRLYRHCDFTPAPIRTYCVISATARKYGLCATASRSVCFGKPEAHVRKDHDAACKVSATYVASSWPDAVPKQIMLTGRRVYLVSDAEHEWLLSPQGFVTGRAPSELPLTPRTEDLLQAGWAVTWRASAGGALSCDTFTLTEDGPLNITPTESWPLKRIRISGAEFMRPDLLIR
jgi:Xaa-Pro dipeptidase